MRVPFGLFLRYGFAENVSKSRTTTCQPGIPRSGMPEEAKTMKCTGVEYSYLVRLRRRIPCLECGVDLTTGSTTAHRRSMHRTEPAINWIRMPVSQTKHQLWVYDVRLLRSTNLCPCPFPSCPGPPTRGMVCLLPLEAINLGIGSGSWRST